MGKRATLAIAGAGIAAMIGLAHPAPAAAQTTALSKGSRCIMHRGAIVIPYLHRYHVRIGVRAGTSGGPGRCFGSSTSSPARAARCCDWIPFSLPRWNWTGILVVGTDGGLTLTACTSFSLALGAEIPTGLLDTGATVLAGAACAKSGQDLINDENHYFYPGK